MPINTKKVIEVDIAELAKYMIGQGFFPSEDSDDVRVMDGWTNSIMDYLESEMRLETELAQAIKKAYTELNKNK